VDALARVSSCDMPLLHDVQAPALHLRSVVELNGQQGGTLECEHAVHCSQQSSHFKNKTKKQFYYSESCTNRKVATTPTPSLLLPSSSFPPPPSLLLFQAISFHRM
jgi:hypothetical protein